MPQHTRVDRFLKDIERTRQAQPTIPSFVPDEQPVSGGIPGFTPPWAIESGARQYRAGGPFRGGGITYQAIGVEPNRMLVTSPISPTTSPKYTPPHIEREAVPLTQFQFGKNIAKGVIPALGSAAETTVAGLRNLANLFGAEGLAELGLSKEKRRQLDEIPEGLSLIDKRELQKEIILPAPPEGVAKMLGSMAATIVLPGVTHPNLELSEIGGPMETAMFGATPLMPYLGGFPAVQRKGAPAVPERPIARVEDIPYLGRKQLTNEQLAARIAQSAEAQTFAAQPTAFWGRGTYFPSGPSPEAIPLRPANIPGQVGFREEIGRIPSFMGQAVTEGAPPYISAQAPTAATQPAKIGLAKEIFEKTGTPLGLTTVTGASERAIPLAGKRAFPWVEGDIIWFPRNRASMNWIAKEAENLSIVGNDPLTNSVGVRVGVKSLPPPPKALREQLRLQSGGEFVPTPREQVTRLPYEQPTAGRPAGLGPTRRGGEVVRYETADPRATAARATGLTPDEVAELARLKGQLAEVEALPPSTSPHKLNRAADDIWRINQRKQLGKEIAELEARQVAEAAPTARRAARVVPEAAPEVSGIQQFVEQELLQRAAVGGRRPSRLPSERPPGIGPPDGVPAIPGAEPIIPPEARSALEKAANFLLIDSEGFTGRFISLIPGISRIQRFLRPARETPEYIQTAFIAQDGIRQALLTRMFGDPKVGRNGILNEIDRLFEPLVSPAGRGQELATAAYRAVRRQKPLMDAGAPSTGAVTKVPFIGTPNQSSAIEGTILDIVQRPQLYELTDAQRAFIGRWRERNTTLLRELKEGYGANVGEFQSAPGGVFMSNVDVSEEVMELLEKTRQQLVLTGRGKTRIFMSAADRMKSDPNFMPLTNIRELQAGMDEWKATVAAAQTFKAGVGGLNKEGVIRITNPRLADKMAGLRRNLGNLRATAGRLDERIEDAVAEFLTSPIDDQNLTNLRDSLDIRVTRGAMKGADARNVDLAIKRVRNEISNLQPNWKAANIKDYQFVKKGIYRWFPVEEAKAVDRIWEISSGWGGKVVRFLDDMRGLIFGGDFSPLAGIQIPVGAIFSPEIAVRALIGAGRDTIKSRDLLHIFRTQTLADDVARNIQSYEDFSYYSGIAVQQGTPSEFAGGFLRKIPGYTKANEAMYSIVVRQSRALYDKQLRILEGDGHTGEVAKMLAADMATKVYPMWRPSRLGLSSSRASLLKSLPTSVSFILQPATLVSEAATGLAKLPLGMKLTAQEKLALRLVTTASASAMTLSITSSVIDALSRGKDPWQAVQEVTDPTSGKFASIIIPGTGRYIPLGGPFRGIAKVIVPRKVGWAPVPVPFANFVNYAKNRVNPFLNTQLSELRNKDFYGGTIRKGKVPEQILRGVLFELEGLSPLTVGSVIEGTRREIGALETLVESGGQFLGTNLGRESPWQEETVTVQNWARKNNLQNVRGMDDLDLLQKAEFEKDEPEAAMQIAGERERRYRQGINVEEFKYFQQLDNIDATFKAEIEKMAESVGNRPNEKFRKGLSDLLVKKSEQKENWRLGHKEISEKLDKRDPSPHRLDRALDAYYEAVTGPDLEDEFGDYDFNEAERRVAALGFSETLMADMLKYRTREEIPLQRQLRQDRETLKEYLEITETLMKDKGFTREYEAYRKMTMRDQGKFKERPENSKFVDALNLAKRVKAIYRQARPDINELLLEWGYKPPSVEESREAIRAETPQ